MPTELEVDDRDRQTPWPPYAQPLLPRDDHVGKFRNTMLFCGARSEPGRRCLQISSLALLRRTQLSVGGSAETGELGRSADDRLWGEGRKFRNHAGSGQRYWILPRQWTRMSRKLCEML